MAEYEYYNYLMSKISSMKNYSFTNEYASLSPNLISLLEEEGFAYKTAKKRAMANFIRDNTTDPRNPEELTLALRKAYEENPDHFSDTPEKREREFTDILREAYEKDPIRYKKTMFSMSPQENEEFPSGFRFALKMVGLDKPSSVGEAAALVASLLPIGRGAVGAGRLIGKGAKAIRGLRAGDDAVSEATGATLRASEGLGNVSSRAVAEAVREAPTVRVNPRDVFYKYRHVGEKEMNPLRPRKFGQREGKPTDVFSKYRHMEQPPTKTSKDVFINPRAKEYAERYIKESTDSPVYSRTRAMRESADKISSTLSTKPSKDEFLEMLQGLYTNRAIDAKEFVGRLIRMLNSSEIKKDRDKFTAIQEFLESLAGK